MQKRTFEVLARLESGEPLRSIGSVDAPNPSFASRYAEMFYDEEEWDLMFVVDRASMYQSKGDPGHEYDDTNANPALMTKVSDAT